MSIINRLLARLGLVLVARSQLLALGAATQAPVIPPDTELPAEARAYLTASNPRLQELRRRYAGHPAADASRWSREFVDQEVSLASFRADNAYVWSSRDAYVGIGSDKTRVATQAINYVLTAYYVLQHDVVGVLAASADDGLFGAPRFAVDERLTVSRDVLDSALELNFLERYLAISTRPQLGVLDVGAGYGRLAHRLVESLPHARAWCADAVPESTFVSEFYLRFRAVDDRAVVVTLDELGSLARGQIDVAVNIHSWSECPLRAIEWWLDLIAGLNVPYVLVVPNDGERLLSLEADGTRRDFAPLLVERGFRAMAVEPKYGSSSCQRFGIYPTYYHLFCRERL